MKKKKQLVCLISVSNKENIISLANALTQLNVKIIATDGTSKLLKKNNINHTKISDFTGLQEMMNGRVKTLHHKIHAGILAQETDKFDIQKNNFEFIDLLIVNLYPFKKVINNINIKDSIAIENIDIGGPTMLRAGAKNFNRVAAVYDTNDYSLIIEEIKKYNGILLNTRKYLAKKVFKYLSNYNFNIYNFFDSHIIPEPEYKKNSSPEEYIISLNKINDMRYGENPHQLASIYKNKSLNDKFNDEYYQIHGEELSYNNILDTDIAIQCIKNMSHFSCIIIKHGNPCGASTSKNSMIEAYKNAFKTDPISSFGGIVICNNTINDELAKNILSNGFFEVLLAKDITNEAKKMFFKRKKLKILIYKNTINYNKEIKSINNKILIQDKDNYNIKLSDLSFVTKKKPNEKELEDLIFGWNIVKFVKSNAIVFAKNSSTIGIGAGQMSRIFSCKIAYLKAQEANLNISNSIVASDAFFPFDDAIKFFQNHRITSIIQPGGSINDKLVIAAANKFEISMVFTNKRSFKH